MLDRFRHHAQSSDSPASVGFAITPNDAAELSEVTRALYIGGDGTLVVEMASGDEVTFANVAQGTLLPLRVRRVKVATTATQIVGLA